MHKHIVSVYLPIHSSVYIYTSVSLSAGLSIYLFVCLYVSLPVCLSACLHTCLPVCMPARPKSAVLAPGARKLEYEHTIFRFGRWTIYTETGNASQKVCKVIWSEASRSNQRCTTDNSSLSIGTATNAMTRAYLNHHHHHQPTSR